MGTQYTKAGAAIHHRLGVAPKLGRNVPHLCPNAATTCRRLAHENIQRPNSPPRPSLETADEQNKILERQHNKNREGGKA